LHGCRLCDLVLAPGRETITFQPNPDTGRGMKNGQVVEAVLHPKAADALHRYLEVRGRLHDREGPLFLTPRGKPYSADSFGVQNKSSFNATKRRARKALRRQQMAVARQQRSPEAAAAIVTKLRADHRLLGKITQHWFRHMLATRMRGDLRSAMEQGGWQDERSVMGYTMDDPVRRRQLVNDFDAGTSTGTKHIAGATK
jgi:integrase